MASKRFSEHALRKNQRGHFAPAPKQVPIQVMVPESIRRQVALMGVNRGENIRTIVLRGLQAIGIDVPDSELGDRRGRHRTGGRHGNGAK